MYKKYHIIPQTSICIAIYESDSSTAVKYINFDYKYSMHIQQLVKIPNCYNHVYIRSNNIIQMKNFIKSIGNNNSIDKNISGSRYSL